MTNVFQIVCGIQMKKIQNLIIYEDCLKVAEETANDVKDSSKPLHLKAQMDEHKAKIYQ